MIALEERRTDIAEKLLEMEAAVAYKNKVEASGWEGICMVIV